MQPVSKFRGSSGEVVKEYVSPVTFISALPVALILLALGWGSDHAGDYRRYISLPLMSLFVSMVTMRVAIPASRGDLEPTNDLGEIVTYTGRFLLLNLAWCIPWLMLWKVTAKSADLVSPIAMMNPVVFMQTPWLLLSRSLLIILALLLPTLCLLVSLYSSSTKGQFKVQSWDWLLNQRRPDLIPYWSTLVGGSCMMILCALLPALILIYLGFKDSIKTGLYVSGFLYLWIVSTIPLLSGRLAGVFVAHDFIQIDFVSDEPLTATMESTSPLQILANRPKEAKPDMAEIEQRLAGLEDSMLPAAMAAASELETSLEAPVRGLIEQTLLSMRLGEMKSAGSFAALAIDSAAQRGFADISMMLFEKFGSARRKLKLAPYSLEILGNIYQQRKQLLDAAWCLHAAALTAGDPIKAQKRLFQIAEIAEKNDKYTEALTLFEILIKQYPNSTLLEFAQQGAARAKNQN